MKHTVPQYSLILLLMVTIAACGRKAATDEADIQTIESTISLFNVSLAKADTAALKEICAPGFVLYEQEQTYELAGLFRSNTGALSSSSMTRRATGVQVATRPDGAWSCYNVIGEFQAEGQYHSAVHIESAYLERYEGRWKVVQVCAMQGDTE